LEVTLEVTSLRYVPGMNQQPPDRLLRSFERYLRATNRSERTVGNYLENLHQVETFLRPRGVRLRDATRADLEDFLADLPARCLPTAVPMNDDDVALP
jgi:site-specific recombinase XerD